MSNCPVCDMPRHPGATCGDNGAALDLMSDAAAIGQHYSYAEALAYVTRNDR